MADQMGTRAVNCRVGPGRWGAACRALVVLAAFLVLAQPSAAAEEALYPHAEHEFGPWGYIDKTGKIVIPLQYDWAEPFSEGRAAVLRDKKYGYIDITGRVVIPLQFDTSLSPPNPFEAGWSNVLDGKQWRLIDRDGVAIDAGIRSGMPPRIQTELSGYLKPSDDWIIVAKNGKRGAIDRSGRFVIEPEYEVLYPFSDGLAAASSGNRIGFIDKTGTFVIPFTFENGVTHFRDGRALVWVKRPKEEVKRDKDGKIVSVLRFNCGFIDRTGAPVIPHQFDDCRDFYEGRAAVRAFDQGWGIIDPEGQFIVAPKFTSVDTSPGFDYFFVKGSRVSRGERSGFSEGLMAVESAERVGYIDLDGKLVIGHRFRRGSLFHDGLAVVVTNAEPGFGIPEGRKASFSGIIDRSGRFVVPPVYDWAWPRPGGLVQVKFGDRLGYLDSSGKPLTFSAQEIETYIAAKREQLKPPPPPAPGRAVIAKAEDGEYYLRLPDGLCALDPNAPRDRKLLDDTLGDVELEATKKGLPQLRPETWEQIKRREWLVPNSGWIVNCDQLQGARAAGSLKSIQTYAFASGMRKSRPDSPANAGLVYISALMCAMADKGAPGAPRTKDGGAARVADAFKRLEAGETTMLGGLIFDGLACHSAALAPATADAGASPPAVAKATATFLTMLWLPDWMIVISAREIIDASPEALFQRLEQAKTLSRLLQDANLKK
jgi:WG repeat protein